MEIFRFYFWVLRDICGSNQVSWFSTACGYVDNIPVAHIPTALKISDVQEKSALRRLIYSYNQ